MYSPQRMSSWDLNMNMSYENRLSSNDKMMSTSRYVDAPALKPPQMQTNLSSAPSAPQIYSTPLKSGVLETCKNQITVTRLIGVIIGLIIAGVPLAVMVTLYLQPVTTTTTTTTTTITAKSSSTTVSMSNTLPYQCSVHTSLSDSTRTITYTSCLTCYCDTSGFNTWYRFTGAPGTRLWTSPPNSNACAAYYTGWFNGTLPATIGATSIGTGCVNVNGALCHPSYSVSAILATNCNGFYVFYMLPYPNCYTRFCVM